jgi:hypothetical protein
MTGQNDATHRISYHYASLYCVLSPLARRDGRGVYMFPCLRLYDFFISIALTFMTFYYYDPTKFLVYFYRHIG